MDLIGALYLNIYFTDICLIGEIILYILLEGCKWFNYLMSGCHIYNMNVLRYNTVFEYEFNVNIIKTVDKNSSLTIFHCKTKLNK